MKHLFLSYELSLLAKEKGFNEKCIAFYEPDFCFIWDQDEKPIKNNKKYPNCLIAPMYQQIIDWFREKYKLDISLSINGDSDTVYAYRVYNTFYPHLRRAGDGDETWEYYKCMNMAIEAAFKLILFYE